MDVELFSLLLNVHTFLLDVENFDPADPRKVKSIKKKAAKFRECIKARMLRATGETDADLA